MATISEILTKRWPGREWTLQNEDYATLIWGHLEGETIVNTNPESAPTLAAIQAFSNDVDLEIAADQRDESREQALQTGAGQLFKALDVLSDFVAEIYRVMPNTQKNNFSATILSRGQALRNRLNEILASLP